MTPLIRSRLESLFGVSSGIFMSAISDHLSGPDKRRQAKRQQRSQLYRYSRPAAPGSSGETLALSSTGFFQLKGPPAGRFLTCTRHLPDVIIRYVIIGPMGEARQAVILLVEDNAADVQ